MSDSLLTREDLDWAENAAMIMVTSHASGDVDLAAKIVSDGATALRMFALASKLASIAVGLADVAAKVSNRYAGADTITRQDIIQSIGVAIAKE